MVEQNEDLIKQLSPAEQEALQEHIEEARRLSTMVVEQEELMRIRMNGEDFLVSVNEVAEIIRPLKITRVPMAPDHLLGITNVRGQIVCVVDPGKVLRLKGARNPKSDTTRFLILRHARMHIGVWVDEVSKLYRVNKELLPETDDGQKGHIRGEIEVEGQTFNLLKITALFN